MTTTVPNTNTDLAKQIAQKLLDIEAVFLRPNEPFTWTSGIKSPIYCDNRMTMSFPEVREMIAQGFAKTIKNNFAEAEVVAGTATAGIPHAAWVADILKLPMVYIRSSSKGHGRENKIEGKLFPNQKVIVIEDLISTGGSSIAAAEAVKESGGMVLGVIAIFSYQFDKAIKAFEEANLPLYTLSNYETLLEVAVEQNIIQKEQLEVLSNWRKDPESFS